LFAETIKKYIVDMYGIDGSRINTEGRTKPVNPSEQPGGTRELVLLRAGDRRVDIGSTSAELLTEVGGGIMKPVQIIAVQTDPLDSHAIFNVPGASEVLQSWTIDLEDERGTKQNYGPFTREQESVPGSSILGNRTEGSYKVTMRGVTKSGLSITKESNMRLVKQNDITQKGFRYSILFDFDKENAVATYDKFLRDIVSPLISNGSTVIVHGHTDIIGEEDYNYKLSQGRAQETQRILQSALSAAGKTNVKFETSGFGEDLGRAPFENNLPEERFYNRTVIIDIVPIN
jgi:outer membrane protein OmpA-like peptidoglycan-associated protein